jgi:hypothetical protein
MTRKDYVEIARVLRYWKPSETFAQAETIKRWESIVTGLADTLYNDNNRFRYEDFFKACDLALRVNSGPRPKEK